jgi:putative peptide zinc metalloprotease protein
MVELLLAALALAVWTHVQDGVVRDVAFVVMVIGGVSTVLFNGNPLLRFDGYYVLSDALDIPNLGPRSNAYIAYLAQRKVLGLRDATSPISGKGEAPLLFGYALAAFAYRWVVAALIVSWAGHFAFWLGVLVAAAVVLLMAVKPLVSIGRFLLHSPALSRSRTRNLGVVSGLAAAALIVLFALPLSFSTVAQGVVWLPEQARIRAQSDGFVVEVAASDGQRVAKGDLLLMLDDPELKVRRNALAARLQSLEVEYNQKMPIDAGEAQSVAEEMEAVRAEVAEAQRRVDALRVTSPVDGALVLPRAQDLPGTFVTQGAVLAHVLRAEDVNVKVAVPQAEAGLIRTGVRAVEVALLDRHGQTVAGKLEGDLPGASSLLPTAALGDRGGGTMPTDPADAEGVRTLEPVFLLDVRLATRTLEHVGSRVWVRFDHGPRPLGLQWYRRVQQLLLKQFNPEG